MDQNTLKKIEKKGFEIISTKNYVGIWKNYPSRGMKEIVFASNEIPEEAFKLCFEKFFNMPFIKDLEWD